MEARWSAISPKPHSKPGCPRCNGLYWGPKKTILQIVCQVKKHSKPTPDIKYGLPNVHTAISLKRCNQYWNDFKCSEKCLKIQQHFRSAQFLQQSPKSKNSSSEKYLSATKYLFVSLQCKVPIFGVNRLQHSWVFCLLHVFKGTLCQFQKIAKRGAAMARLGSAVWLGSIKHCSQQVQQVGGARRGTAWGRCSTA